MIIDQQMQVHFLMTHVLQQQPVYCFHMEHQSISSFEHLFVSFFSDVFTCQLDFSLFSSLNIESSTIPAGNYMFKVNNRNFRTRCEIYSKLTRKTPERRQWLEWVQSWSHASWVTNDKAVLKKLLTVLPETGLRRRERKIRMVIAKFFALYANPKRMAVQNSSYFKIAKESYYRFNFYIP